MQYLIITLCALLACTKVTIQANLAKGNIKNTTDSALANCLIFAFISILFSLSLKNGINPKIIGYAVAFGALSASFQIFYALALKSGPFSATCVIINLSMVVPVVFSLIFFGEKVTLVKATGVMISVVALFLNTKNDGKKPNVKWFIYVTLAYFLTGFISVVQKAFAKSEVAGNYEQFVFFGYLTSFIIAFVLFNILKRVAGGNANFKITKKNVLLAVGVAAALGMYQFCKTYGDSFVPTIILNPSISALSITFQMISARIIFKEKFTPKQICAIIIGIIAILVISL